MRLKMKKAITLSLVFLLSLGYLMAGDSAALNLAYKPEIEDASFLGLSANPISFTAGGSPIMDNSHDATLSKNGTYTLYLGWQYRQSNPKETTLTVQFRSANGRILQSGTDSKEIRYDISVGSMMNAKDSIAYTEDFMTGGLTDPSSCANLAIQNTVEEGTGLYPYEFWGCVPLTVALDDHVWSEYKNATYTDTITVSVVSY